MWAAYQTHFQVSSFKFINYVNGTLFSEMIAILPRKSSILQLFFALFSSSKFYEEARELLFKHLGSDKISLRLSPQTITFEQLLKAIAGNGKNVRIFFITVVNFEICLRDKKIRANTFPCGNGNDKYIESK